MKDAIMLRSILLLLPILAIGLSGCGTTEEYTVATIDDYELSFDELDRTYGARNREFESIEDQYEVFRNYLDTLVVERMLIEAAYDKGMDQSDDLTRLLLVNKNRFLVDALYRRHVTDKVEVTEQDVVDYFFNLGYYVQASHILVDNLDTAQMLVDRILAGENFGELAYRYSISPEAKKKRGELGYFTWGEMVPEFQEAAFNMEIGEISPPVKSRFGYHVIKVTDRTSNKNRGSLTGNRGKIKTLIMRQRVTEVATDYIDSVRTKYPVTIDTVTLDYLVHKKNSLYPPSVVASLPDDDFDEEQLDRDERELIVAIWNGGQMTLVDYIIKARENIPARIRPPFDAYDSVATMVFQLNLDQILAQEAIAEGIEQDETFLDNFRLFKEFNMSHEFREDSLPEAPEPIDEEVRAYYDENIEEYTDPAKVRIYEILVSDEMKANQLASEIATLSAFKANAAKLTERPAKRGTNGDMDYIERKWFPELFDAAWETPIGRMGGPVPTIGKYSIFWVVDKIEAAPRDYLQVKPDIAAKMQLERREDVLREWIDERWDEMGVEVYEDNLWQALKDKVYAEVEDAEGSPDDEGDEKTADEVTDDESDTIQ